MFIPSLPRGERGERCSATVLVCIEMMSTREYDVRVAAEGEEM
jgi:hypothetical protein